ncbi:MAG: iron-containing alcohol dehydrogenase [Candidatus Helarchaeota archaeon]
MWFFASPKLIVFGDDSLSYLAQVKAGKVFVVTDKDVVKLGFYDILKKQLDKMKVEVKLFDECEVDAPLPIIKKGAKLCLEFRPDLIIGLGGGSVLDSAKGLLFLYEMPDDDLHNLQIFRTDVKLQQKCKLILIPTTSGTGAEVTYPIVISDPEEKRKFFATSREVIPEIAIVDPIFPSKMPPRLTAGTGMDVLTHAIEGYTTSPKNVFSDHYSIGAVRMVFESLEKAVNDPDKKSRIAMHNAATIAGLAFGNSQAGSAHAIGHSIGAMFHKPHGTCVGLALPYVMEYNSNNSEESMKNYAELARRALDIWIEDDKEACKKLIENVKKLIENIKGPRTLQDLGITKEDIDKNMETLLRYTDEDATTTMNKPIPDIDDYKKMYEYMLIGKNIDF